MTHLLLPTGNQRKREEGRMSNFVRCGIHNYGHVSELLTLRQAASYLVCGIRDSFIGGGSPEHFLLFLFPSS